MRSPQRVPAASRRVAGRENTLGNAGRAPHRCAHAAAPNLPSVPGGLRAPPSTTKSRCLCGRGRRGWRGGAKDGASSALLLPPCTLAAAGPQRSGPTLGRRGAARRRRLPRVLWAPRLPRMRGLRTAAASVESERERERAPGCAGAPAEGPEGARGPLALRPGGPLAPPRCQSRRWCAPGASARRQCPEQ